MAATLSPAAASDRHTDAVPSRRRREEERAMEIAAVLMFAAAVMGFVQQFDNPSW
jgi:hypothetical protein